MNITTSLCTIVLSESHTHTALPEKKRIEHATGSSKPKPTAIIIS